MNTRKMRKTEQEDLEAPRPTYTTNNTMCDDDTDHEDGTLYDSSDDILWGDCTEELYLRRMLEERQADKKGSTPAKRKEDDDHDEGDDADVEDDDDDLDAATFVDSIMGQSTVAEILSGEKPKHYYTPPSRLHATTTNSNEEDEDNVDYGDDKNNKSFDSADRRQSWMRFAPMAGSMTTMEDGTVFTNSSLRFSSVDGERLEDEDINDVNVRPSDDETSTIGGEAPAPPRRGIMMMDDDIESFRNLDRSMVEDDDNDHRQDRAALFPGGVVPKYVDSDEDDESTMVYYPHMMGGTQAIYDRYDAENQQYGQDEHTLPGAEGDASEAGISTLTGDSLLRYGGQDGTNLFQYEHPKWWTDLEEAKRKKREELARNQQEAATAAQSLPSRTNSQQNGSTNKKKISPMKRGSPEDIQLTLTQSLSAQSHEGDSSTTKERRGCFSRLLHSVAGNDTVFRRFVGLSVLMILVFASLAAYAIVQARGSPSSSSSSNSVGPSPTMSPILPSQPTTTSSPTESTISDPYPMLVTLIQEESPVSLQALLDEESPQYRALAWLTDDLQGASSLLSKTEILQRWTMAILYFSTNGDAWTNRQGWLSNEDSICDWYSTTTVTEGYSSCDDQGLLQYLNLQGNNLVGTIPQEIRHLSESLVVLNLSQNQLSGVIPQSIAEFTNLSVMKLESNEVVGSIPLTMCEREAEAVLSLSVDCMDVSCSCCDCW